MKHIYFTAWGSRDIDVPAYALLDEDESKAYAVARAIANKNGMAICAGPRFENSNVTNNNVITDHNYQITLGRPVKTGGYSVEAQVWFSIPVSK